jgi:hypothetical protein
MASIHSRARASALAQATHASRAVRRNPPTGRKTVEFFC